MHCFVVLKISLFHYPVTSLVKIITKLITITLNNNCPKCVVFHNNWIVSKEAKIYRFKETNMWFLDDDRYYSDENRKYLLYYNPIITKPPKGFNVREAKTSALRNGFMMAEILNRTLIIPRCVRF